MRRSIFLVPIIATTLGTILIGATAVRHQRRAPDFDGDGRADFAIWRPTSSEFTADPRFYAITSGTDYSPVSALSFPLGNVGDTPVLADFDGDGKTDFAVYRPTLSYAWFIRRSSDSFATVATYQWGVDGDLPVPGDYDGDGKTDIAVFRRADGGWYILQGGNNFTSAFAVFWGGRGSTPVPADYDGDGKLDIATFDPGAEGDTGVLWYILQGGTGFRSAFSVKFGTVGTVPVPADYDGDGKVDVAVYNPGTSTFSVLYSSTRNTSGVTKQWGVVGDTPVSADFDGDGKADMAVFRPSTGTYYVLQASANFTTAFSRTMSVGGTSADVPAMAR